jgi:hypothetical protein
MATQARHPSRWTARPVQAGLLRAVVLAAPLAAAVVFVHFASRVVRPPTSSLWLFLGWWLGLGVLATLVLTVVDGASRRLLPLVALLKLSLIFPDEVPSRFKAALRAGSVDTLEQRLRLMREARAATTAREAAERLLALVAALDRHDRLTRGHSERVRAYSVLIGRKLGLRDDEVDLLNWAALLHDVGKLRVPAEILTKNGRPDEEEWAILRQHPLFGEELAGPIAEWLGEWTEAIGYHHEHWDGRGYPRGASGDDIPLAGRIVAVADVFDVITSARSYKEPAAASTGRTEVARCAGSQFDPRVVRAFLNVSLGRMRLVMGPLSLLSHLQLLSRIPLTPAMGTLAGTFTVVAGSLAGGLVSQPATAVASPAPSRAHVAAPAHAVAPPTSPERRRHPARPGPIHQVSVHLVRRDAAPIAGAPAPAATTPAVPPSSRRSTNGKSSTPAKSSSTPAATAQQPVKKPSRSGNPASPAPPVAVDVRASVREGGSVVIDVLARAGNPGRQVLTIASVGRPDHGTATVAAGRIRYDAAIGYHGPASFPFTIAGEENGTSTAAVRLDVSPVNQPPGFTAGPDQTVLEDSGAHAVRSWATSISAGPPDEAGQSVSFAVRTDAAALFSRQPAVDPKGTLTFKPAPDASGTAVVQITPVDDGGTANGGNDTGPTRSIRITVAGVNDAPSFTAGANQSVLENVGARTVHGWATSIAAGPSNESGQKVSFTLTDDDPGLFSVPPAIAADGTLTFTPAADASGVATIGVRAVDDGGTANGGSDRSAAHTFTITVLPVNRAPSFTDCANQSVLEDAGSQTVAACVTSISPGPPNESGQTVTFSLSSSDASLFGAQPAVASDGTLTYTPAPNANGSATVTVRAVDDGGTANGGSDTSAPQQFTITVTAVNDAPSFAAGSNQSVVSLLGAQTVKGWATGISPGPADEAGQTVTFTVSTDKPGLFAAQPAVSSSGTLTYTPKALALGTATVTVRAVDSGGTDNGGADTSPAQTFTITIL